MALLDDIKKKASKELDKQMKGQKDKHVKNLEKTAKKELKKRFKI
jgi:hypothetical protein